MPRYVLGPDAALALAARRAIVPKDTRLLAPTLLRSQVLAQLYQWVRSGHIDDKESRARLDHLRRLQVRYLGDRSMQQVAWRTAARLGWDDTFVAEYVALTLLQADALVVLEAGIARSVAGLVRTATLEKLLGEGR